jgi:hypothetical protein
MDKEGAAKRAASLVVLIREIDYPKAQAVAPRLNTGLLQYFLRRCDGEALSKPCLLEK